MASSFIMDIYSTERELYKILVIDLSRDSTESMKLIALWLWLEEVGYHNLVDKIYFSSYTIINELAEEGVMCLNCINTSMRHSSFEDNDIPQMCSLMYKQISLQILYQNKISAVQGVNAMLKNVCESALGDIKQQVNTRNSSENVEENYKQIEKIISLLDL